MWKGRRSGDFFPFLPFSNPKESNLKIVLISDTHEQHEKLGSLPEGEVLIHAGDYTYVGRREAKKKFFDWFLSQPHPHKLYIAGNHDFGEPQFPSTHFPLESKLPHLFPLNTHYLFNSGVEIAGVRFWGSPYTPRFGQWAFMKEREEMGKIWEGIPLGTHFLITHGPPHGILDQPFGNGEHVGDEALRDRIEIVNPLYHVFGHIHGSSGRVAKGMTNYVNASVVDEDYQVVNAPVVVQL